MRIVDFWGPGPDLARYLELPARLYAGDPHWVPPSRDALLEAFSPANPFFTVGTARHFLALDGDRPVGRVTAIRNRRLEAREGPVGLLGFFECEPDLAVANRLLGAAAEHLRSAGLRTVRAPVDFDTWHRYRFMVKGFDEPPILLEPYNKLNARMPDSRACRSRSERGSGRWGAATATGVTIPRSPRRGVEGREIARAHQPPRAAIALATLETVRTTVACPPGPAVVA